MNDDLLLKGLSIRSKVSTQAEVDRAFADPSLCVQAFEEFSTEQYWGGCWGDETLSPRERTFLTLGMTAAVGRRADFANAVEIALNNGISEAEIRAAVKQIMVWCGIAIGSDCVRTARQTIDRREKARRNSEGYSSNFAERTISSAHGATSAVDANEAVTPYTACQEGIGCD
jgi:4-carboxymuconolactone decarboxylase